MGWLTSSCHSMSSNFKFPCLQVAPLLSHTESTFHNGQVANVMITCPESGAVAINCLTGWIATSALVFASKFLDSKFPSQTPDLANSPSFRHAKKIPSDSLVGPPSLRLNQFPGLLEAFYGGREKFNHQAKPPRSWEVTILTNFHPWEGQGNAFQQHMAPVISNRLQQQLYTYLPCTLGTPQKKGAKGHYLTHLASKGHEFLPLEARELPANCEFFVMDWPISHSLSDHRWA